MNGVSVKQNYKVKPGDQVSVLLTNPKRENLIIPQDIPINIVYEDDDVVVVDKAAGMVVHPGHGNYDGTLVNALAFHFEKNGQKSDLDRVGLVHRIDKDTSGGNIGRHLKNRMQMAVFEDGSLGKHAVTHYKVLERLRYITWVECKLETGRTHQIRAHFKHIGHTLFNDERYEGNQILKGVNMPKYKQFIKNVFEILPRHALHAHTLGFVHPTTKEELFFESTMPEDMEQALQKWRKYLES